MILGTKVCRTNTEIVVVLSPTRVRKYVREWLCSFHQQPSPFVSGCMGVNQVEKNLIKNPCLCY